MVKYTSSKMREHAKNSNHEGFKSGLPDSLKKHSKEIMQHVRTGMNITEAKDTTTIVDGKGSAEALEARAEELKVQIDNAQSMFEREKLQERLGRLSGGVAIISVGGNSDLEIKEKRDRVEDALYATKAAIAGGVIPGVVS